MQIFNCPNPTITPGNITEMIVNFDYIDNARQLVDGLTKDKEVADDKVLYYAACVVSEWLDDKCREAQNG